MNILFENGMILQRDEQGRYSAIPRGYLGVKDNQIAYIGTSAPSESYEQHRDMTGKLLMPGLINAHGHAAMTLLRGVGSGLPLHRWLNEAIFPIEAKMVPEDIVAGTRWAIMEMLASGTTACSEMYDFPWAAAQVFADAGMKANLGRVMLCFDPSMKAEDCQRLQECDTFIKHYDGMGGGLIKAEWAPHSEYLTTENTMTALALMAHHYSSNIQIHVSETKAEHEECKQRRGGMTPVQYLKKIGVLNTPTYMAHCVWLEDEDLAILKECGATLVHNPTSNMKLGSGFAPIAKALEMGVNVALGTDGCASNNNLNMFEEMHLAALLQKGLHNDPTLVTADQVLDMATVSGAKALGRPDTGMLCEGMKADIIALDMDRFHLKPAGDIANLLVYSAQASDVVMTMVEGNVLYDNGCFTTIDAKRAEEAYFAAIRRLMTPQGEEAL
ncbi:MAG: amidohydrolase [Firmicutes bacterium]|nr:amidohydrolase [Bacillota bacterium]